MHCKKSYRFLVTSRLGTGKSVTIFYSVEKQAQPVGHLMQGISLYFIFTI
jgi:hypothetical protein